MIESTATDALATVPAAVVPTSSPGNTKPPAFRAAFNDPVLRVLASATLVATLGRGVFLTLTILYFTHFVGLTPLEIAVVLSVSSGIGVATSYLGGRLADRISARRLLAALTVVEGGAIILYSFAGSFTWVLLIACVAVGLNRAANSARSAIIARAFDGPHRVNTRAVLRTVTNIGIAGGGMIGGLALLAGTAEAYRALLIGAGVAYILSAVRLLRLPPRVDAPRHDPLSTAARGVPPFRNRRYVLLTVLSGIFGMQFGLAEMGVPLWIAHSTEAPDVLISVVLVINTICVILFQIPLSRGTEDPLTAGRIVLVSGILMVAACALYALSGGAPVIVAVVLLCSAALLHAFAEIMSQAGTWGLSFELADPRQAGAYQGLFGMGFSLGAMLAPLVVTATVVENGVPGWAILAAILLAAALGISLIAHRAGKAVETYSGREN